MKILKIQVLRGPNVWSNYRKKLIQMRLDLEELEEYPTNKIEGFKERLSELIPSLVEHHCSEGVYGGFLSRVNEGTWMGHVIEHIALELQTLAGMETNYGRTRSTKTLAVYNVVFEYADEEAGKYTAEAAVKVAEALVANKPYDITKDIEELKKIYKDNALGPSTKSIVDEAISRDIPWLRLDNDSTIQLGYGANQMRFQATTTCKTSQLAVDIACNKDKTKRMLDAASLPVPEGTICSTTEELDQCIEDIDFPLVIKPLDGNQGKGASINVTSPEQARAALLHAQQYSREVVVERYISGHDFRMLVINHKFVAAARRMPAHVTGNGIDSIHDLISAVNKDANRGNGHENILTKITFDKDTFQQLENIGYTLESIPDKGEIIYLKSTANLSTGGTAEDVTDLVHPDNIALAEKTSRIIGLDICGIDIMAQSLETPITATGGAILEVNAAPGFRMHLSPSKGTPRNVAAPVVDMLFPESAPSRIPIIAVTGTNGKTTTTRLIAHIAKERGYNVGFTTTDGTYINNVLQEKGDNTGPASAQYLLKDPTVDFAVLETARGGILRSGLGFDKCDVGIITNIEEDHLGLNDIVTLDDLARVKSVVVNSVKEDGWAVLNAENKHCLQIGETLDCNTAYFSMNENETTKALAESGKTLAVYEKGFITIIDNKKRIRITHVINIPLTQNGEITFMVANALAAVLGAYVAGFSIEDLRATVRTFAPCYEQTPGRMNMFQFNKFKVLVDYAHNPHGYEAIANYLQTQSARRKIGIVSGVGDRRDIDIINCAEIAARMFDHIIIRQEHDLRGRTEEELNDLIISGIKNAKRRVTFETVSLETMAIRHAIEIARDGDFIIALTDQVNDVINVIHELQEKENMQDHFVSQSA